MSNFNIDNIDKSNWNKYKFSEIAESINERVDPTNTSLDIYVGLEHLDSDSIHIKRFGKRTDVKGIKLKVYPGDIVFGRRRAYQRKAAIANFEGFCSAHALVLRAKSEIISPKLFPFFLHSDTFMNRAVDISVGSLSPTINWGTLKNQEFLLPPKNQQEKIAELLWAGDETKERLEILKENLVLLYQTIIERELISKNGKNIKLSNLGTVIRGVGYKPEELQDTYEKDCCIILRANNIKDSLINYDEIKILRNDKIKEVQYLREGDFAICMSNGSKELVGKAACYTNSNNNVCVGSFCSVFRADSIINRDLMRHLFFSNTYRNKIKNTISGSNINNLKPSDIENMEFRIVKDINVEVIINELNTIYSKRGLIERCLEHTKEINKILINEIFTL